MSVFISIIIYVVLPVAVFIVSLSLAWMVGFSLDRAGLDFTLDTAWSTCMGVGAIAVTLYFYYIHKRF